MRSLFLIIACLQLFTVIQCSLTDEGIGVKGTNKYNSFGTARVNLENGTVIKYGVIIITPCLVVTVADACNDSKAMEIWSGQRNCSTYEQLRLVSETYVQEDLCVAVTTKPFAFTGATQPAGTDFVDCSTENVTAVGCAPPYETINTATFNHFPLQACKDYYNDTTLGADVYCAECPIPASTCSAPRGNPIYCNGKAFGISNKVHPEKCATGGLVQFTLLSPYEEFIIEVFEKTQQKCNEQMICQD
ncbi:uncharacterized protein LOC105231403 [Bactrocera dorsalis]|uniref:Uncharacterized protein LOC105231403 n=1 Tax=Bactrocera dorsalis TaxID=27457 RepID=A0ABM3JV66_BACDO|nr:uncharacterized protein LOC105231403 [Bactrocera dorsalis]